MSRAWFLGLLLFVILISGFSTLRGTELALAVPVLLYLLYALWRGPDGLDLQISRQLSAERVPPPRVVLVASGLYREAYEVAPEEGATGLALGLAPTSRLSLWTQADVRFREGSPGEPGYTLLADAGLEVFRGVWLKLTPQLRTDHGDASAGLLRLAFGLNLLPRTHWNALLSYYRDGDRKTDRTSNTLLLQLHLYL